VKEIFEILEQNGRATPGQISTMADEPVGEVEKIIKQAEKDGAILKYKAIINWPKLGERDIGFNRSQSNTTTWCWLRCHC